MGSSRELVRAVKQKYGVTEDIAVHMVQQATVGAAAQRDYQKKIAAARQLTYEQWLQTEKFNPEMRWDFSWQKFLMPYIEAIVCGDIHQLVINIQPRVGKSEFLTKRLPVYWLERNPRDGVIVGAYGSTLAETFTQASMDIYRYRNPGDIRSEAREEWTTVHGGFVKPVGVGSGITGRGAELLLLDDPVRSISDALSRAQMDKTWNWMVADIFTRRNTANRTPTILVMTRWTDDDPTGRIMNSPNAKDWTLVVLPAIAEENDPMGRQPGEVLVPERFSYESLKSAEEEDPIIFSGLYQQKPIQSKSASFKTERLQLVDASDVPLDAHRIRYWDQAASAGKGDWTVGVLMARDEIGKIYVENVVRGQWGEDEVEDKMRETALLDHAKHGSRNKWIMRQVYEREPGGSGKRIAAHMGRTVFAGMDAKEDRPNENKGARARPFAAAVNRGEVSVVKDVNESGQMGSGSWTPKYINELRVFVIGLDNRVDDQVDASSGAYNQLTVEFTVVTIS